MFLKLTPQELVENVSSREEAECIIACLLQQFGGQTAKERLDWEAYYAKQASIEMARRTAANLLTSLEVRRPQF